VHRVDRERIRPRFPGDRHLRHGQRHRDRALRRREHAELHLDSSDWFGGSGDVALGSGYQNRQPAGPVTSVQLPNVIAAAILQVFAMTIG
jgi:hypothetical protein